jgi:hypothetical protein
MTTSKKSSLKAIPFSTYPFDSPEYPLARDIETLLHLSDLLNDGLLKDAWTTTYHVNGLAEHDADGSLYRSVLDKKRSNPSRWYLVSVYALVSVSQTTCSN